MSRTVTVRYIVPVYVTVDIDATKAEGETHYPDGSVREVFVADEEIGWADGVKAYIDPDLVIEEAYDLDAVDLAELSFEDSVKALDVAENTVWPAWGR